MEVVHPAAVQDLCHPARCRPFGLAASLPVQQCLPVPVAQRHRPCGPGDFLRFKDELIACAGDQSGQVGVWRRFHPDRDLQRSAPRAAVQQCPGAAAQPDEQLQVLVEDPSQQLQRGDEVALACPVRADQDVQPAQSDPCRAD